MSPLYSLLEDDGARHAAHWRLKLCTFVAQQRERLGAMRTDDPTWFESLK
jgi:hypothetical protein